MNTYSCSHLVRTLAHVPFVFEHNVTTTVTITFVVIPGATIPTRACHVISSPKQTFAHQHLAIPTHNSLHTTRLSSWWSWVWRGSTISHSSTKSHSHSSSAASPIQNVPHSAGTYGQRTGTSKSPMTHPSRQGLLNQLGSFGAHLRGSGSLYLTSATVHPHLSFVHPPHFFLRQNDKGTKESKTKSNLFFFFFF